MYNIHIDILEYTMFICVSLCVVCMSVYVFHLYDKPTWHRIFYSGPYFTMVLEMSNLSFSKNRTSQVNW